MELKDRITLENYGVWDRMKPGGTILGILNTRGQKCHLHLELNTPISSIHTDREGVELGWKGREAEIYVGENVVNPVLLKFVCKNAQCIDMVDFVKVSIED